MSTLSLPLAADVSAVIPNTLSDAEIDLIVLEAETIANQCSEVAGLEATTQAAIVKYIAAHMISLRKGTGGQVTSDALGDASKSYAAPAPVNGSGLNSTRFGQMAILLEPSGCLERLGARKVRFKVL